jgi:pyruvate/2-oxoglutarate dehydrogenase complex dihydrolipoamide dehydrogenase (E3) component
MGNSFDITVIGLDSGDYITGIKAAQYGDKPIIVEK